jgi:predicted amidohydrolase YtcJ
MVILEGGILRTMDATNSVAVGMLIEGDQIVEVFSDPQKIPRDLPRINLNGACVLPGLTDSHVHFPHWAVGREALVLGGANSLAETLSLVENAVGGVKDGNWLRGAGWMAEEWVGGGVPTKQALDAVSGETPVALFAHDYHTLWVNSAGLSKAHGELAVAGGVVELDEDGEPTGVLRETAAWKFFEEYVEASHAEKLSAMRRALPVAAAAGVVSVHDKDGAAGAYELFTELSNEGELTLRVWQSLPAVRLSEGITPDLDSNPLLRIGYVKAFMDGTLGSRTARLLDGSGVQITGKDELAEIIRQAEGRGFGVAVHAIGDLANRDALDAFERAGSPTARHRIEHAQCIAPEDTLRFAKLGVTASVQYSHAVSDWKVANLLWADRMSHAYPYQALNNAQALLAGGSDSPIEALDPVEGLRAAVSGPQPPIPLQAALESFTTVPAWLTFEENKRGKLRKGHLADITILSHDPFENLDEATVLGTMLAGRWTFGEDNFDLHQRPMY